MGEKSFERMLINYFLVFVEKGECFFNVFE
jgi:hypothetical protein